MNDSGNDVASGRTIQMQRTDESRLWGCRGYLPPLCFAVSLPLVDMAWGS